MINDRLPSGGLFCYADNKKINTFVIRNFNKEHFHNQYYNEGIYIS